MRDFSVLTQGKLEYSTKFLHLTKTVLNINLYIKKLNS